ncbi:hypothetical protein PVAG01_05905 [Phlyctema vagabunda]|uniref:Phytocyanin domain-containing protein n=1 Tax=Phlyctema vagabunda TaxID=108571 RepID=A0ABR4PEJ4_9HELO
MFRTFLSLIAVAAVASAATIEISVGQNRGIAFNPSSVTAAVGDVLAFHFYSGTGGHSVVSTNFEAPCVPNNSSFFSGYIPGNDQGNQTFEITVNSTDPIWFYCSLNRHCQNGMVGVVNPPAGTDISAFQSAAANVAAASAPSTPIGGLITTASPSNSSGNATVISGAPTSSQTSSGTAAASSTNGGVQVFGEMTTIVTLVVAGGIAALMV